MDFFMLKGYLKKKLYDLHLKNYRKENFESINLELYFIIIQLYTEKNILSKLCFKRQFFVQQAHETIKERFSLQDCSVRISVCSHLQCKETHKKDFHSEDLLQNFASTESTSLITL